MPRFSFNNTKGESIAIRVAATARTITIGTGVSAQRLTRAEALELLPTFESMHGSGYLDYDEMEDYAADNLLAIPQLVSLGTPAAKGTTNVHAALAGNAAVAFPGPFTDPGQPRNLRCVFASSYDGGDVTIYGTDQFDQPVNETFTAVAATTVVGTKVFKTVTSAVRSTVGATANTVSIGTGDKVGLTFKIVDTVGCLYANGVLEAVTLDATYHAYTPTTAPNGSAAFKLLANV